MRMIALLFLTVAPAMAQDLPPGLVSAEMMPGWVTPEGNRITALHLRLEPGWKTYWRSPGDAGVPPRFDWAGSQNLGEVRLLWPRPEVIESEGERTLGYREELILPIEITPPAPAPRSSRWPRSISASVRTFACLHRSSCRQVPPPRPPIR
ncbi:protein-disulfide reductase DsbD domain-containing protein [Paracoccus kondratievae]